MSDQPRNASMHGWTSRLALALLLATASLTAVADSDVADALMNGDESRARALLLNGADINAAQADGATALHWAVFQQRSDLVNDLLAAGADVTSATLAGATPLSLAASEGDSVIIASLLAAGADPNERLANGESPLMMAARNGNTDALKVLLDAGADVDARETLRGTTALMWAAANRNAAAVQLLLARGANHAAASNTRPPGRRPYLADTARDRIKAYHLGVGQAGASIAVNLEGIPQDKEKLERRASGLAADVISREQTPTAAPTSDESNDLPTAAQARTAPQSGGLTALVFAAREGDLASIKALLDGGADINQATEYGWTALLTATQNRFYVIGEYLLQHGADPNIANKGGWTPLYLATDNRNIEGGDYPTRKPDMDHLAFIQLLLAHGANPNLRMQSSTETRTIFTHQWLHEEGATPFLRAAQSGDTALMKLLLAHGADPNINLEDGTTPLMVAAGIGWVEGVTYEWSAAETLAAAAMLIELGNDVNAQDTVDMRTALMGAAHKGRAEVIQLLVDHGARLDTRDIGSRDSLHTLAGKTWQAIDYADGLVRVGVQSAVTHPEAAALLRQMMLAQGLPVPAEGRTLDSICIVDLCK
ncbi:MAG: ankyrin repeat domain-containing protein [Gammaproteobacteria bacterium]|nr:ankyrin repeat domain-containing protein [Gammaproteobacteria bacterium]